MSQSSLTPTWDQLTKWLAEAPKRAAAEKRQEFAAERNRAHAARLVKERGIQKAVRTRVKQRFPNVPNVEPMWRLLMAMEPGQRYAAPDFEIIAPDHPRAYCLRLAVELMRMGLVSTSQADAALYDTTWSISSEGGRLRAELIARRMSGDFIPSRHFAEKAIEQGGVLAAMALTAAECDRGPGRGPDGKLLPGFRLDARGQVSPVARC